MEDSVFFKYHTERSLHRELTNIFFFAQMNQNTITVIVMKMARNLFALKTLSVFSRL